MAKELNEDTGFKVSIKSLAGLGFVMATIIGMWFTLQADIAEAKELPAPLPPDVSLSNTTISPSPNTLPTVFEAFKSGLKSGLFDL